MVTPKKRVARKPPNKKSEKKAVTCCCNRNPINIVTTAKKNPKRYFIQKYFPTINASLPTLLRNIQNKYKKIQINVQMYSKKNLSACRCIQRSEGAGQCCNGNLPKFKGVGVGYWVLLSVCFLIDSDLHICLYVMQCTVNRGVAGMYCACCE